MLTANYWTPGDPSGPAMDAYAFEAWERMTYGGWVCSIFETHRSELSELIETIAAGVNERTPLQRYFDATS